MLWWGSVCSDSEIWMDCCGLYGRWLFDGDCILVHGVLECSLNDEGLLDGCVLGCFRGSGIRAYCLYASLESLIEWRKCWGVLG